MRLLKFQIYNRGNVGLFNNLMSLELGIGLSIVSDRLLLVVRPEFPVFNSEKGLDLFDFMDVAFPHVIGDFAEMQGELLPELHGAQFTNSDLRAFDVAPVLATRDDQTLGYYSYALPVDTRVVHACNQLVTAKDPYRRVAMRIVRRLRHEYDTFASVHVRRSDFMSWQEQPVLVTADEILYNIQCHVPSDCFLLIHSDERDPRYFQAILDAYPNHCMIDEALFQEFHPHRFDTAEIGMVSALIAIESDFFVGTMFSTFTGHIQRKRLLSGKRGGFLFVYNQRPGGLAFQDGRILERSGPEPTWQRIEMSDELKSICFWWREWPESVCGAEFGE